MSDILDVFLSTYSTTTIAADEVTISPLGALSLWNNYLTYVPHQVKFFSKLDWLNLWNNEITAIESDAIDSTVIAFHYLDLARNQLTTIAPEAFKGSFFNTFSVAIIFKIKQFGCTRKWVRKI